MLIDADVAIAATRRQMIGSIIQDAPH